MSSRHYSFLDNMIMNLDQTLRTLVGGSPGDRRTSPAIDIEESEMSEDERRESCSLMRVNHSGEIAAQAL